MDISALNPRWVGLHGWSSPSIYYIGITFDSPTTGKRLAALFEPAIDPEGLEAKYGWGSPFPNQKKWKRTGDACFSGLTLTPSLDFSAAGEWHGYITAGNVT